MLAGSPRSAPSSRRGLTNDRLMMAFGVLLFSGFSAALRSIAYICGSRRPEARMTGVLAKARSPANSINAMIAHCALEMQPMLIVPLTLRDQTDGEMLPTAHGRLTQNLAGMLSDAAQRGKWFVVPTNRQGSYLSPAPRPPRK